MRDVYRLDFILVHLFPQEHFIARAMCFVLCPIVRHTQSLVFLTSKDAKIDHWFMW